MPDLSILNTLIAMVIVILVLSLIVQSLQTLVKKFFKLKSRTILNSLVDLFETITPKPDATTAAGASVGVAPKQLVENVIDRLKEMGRETLLGRPMLDSLAKDDLLKVLTRVEVNNLLPGSVDKFQAVLGAIDELKKEFTDINAGLLEGGASANFAALQASVIPLVNDIEALASGGKINPKVLLGDLSNLRQIKAAEVLGILGQVQQKAGEDLEAAGAANDAAQKALADAQKSNDQAQIAAAQESADKAKGRLEGATAVSDGLKKIAQQLNALGQAFDSAFAPVRDLLQQAEVWYDTVMQGFEERYTRHMRTVSLVISIIVVVLLNANFFNVYRAIAADPAKTAAIAEMTPQILKESKEVTGAQDGAATAKPANASASPAPAASPSASPAASPSPLPAASSSPSASPSASPARVGASAQTSPTPTETPVTVEDLKKQSEKVSELVGTYKSFGIEPLTWEQFVNGITFKTPAGTVFETVIGWIIMVILLSAGAPFWQDTLESLFGLKNLLRQKSDTKNVEDEKGGQPKP